MLGFVQTWSLLPVTNLPQPKGAQTAKSKHLVTHNRNAKGLCQTNFWAGPSIAQNTTGSDYNPTTAAKAKWSQGKPQLPVRGHRDSRVANNQLRGKGKGWDLHIFSWRRTFGSLHNARSSCLSLKFFPPPLWPEIAPNLWYGTISPFISLVFRGGFRCTRSD